MSTEYEDDLVGQMVVVPLEAPRTSRTSARVALFNEDGTPFTGGGGGGGGVQRVSGVEPDEDGNVPLTYADIGPIGLADLGFDPETEEEINAQVATIQEAIATKGSKDVAEEIAGLWKFVEGIALGDDEGNTNIILTSESNTEVDCLQLGIDAAGVIREKHLTTADQLDTGTAANFVINPGRSRGTNQPGATLALSSGLSTGSGVPGSIFFMTSPAYQEAGDAIRPQVIQWIMDSTGSLQPGSDNAGWFGSPSSRIGRAFLGQALNIGNAPAESGVIRLDNNGAIKARNAGNTADVELVRLSTSDRVLVGGVDIAPRGTVVLRDDFSTNRLAEWTAQEATTKNGLVVTGGALTTAAAENVDHIIHHDTASLAEGRMLMRVVPGNGNVVVAAGLKWVDDNNYMTAQYFSAGSATTITLYLKIAGALSQTTFTVPTNSFAGIGRPFYFALYLAENFFAAQVSLVHPATEMENLSGTDLRNSKSMDLRNYTGAVAALGSAVSGKPSVRLRNDSGTNPWKIDEVTVVSDPATGFSVSDF